MCKIISEDYCSGLKTATDSLLFYFSLQDVVFISPVLESRLALKLLSLLELGKGNLYQFQSEAYKFLAVSTSVLVGYPEFPCKKHGYPVKNDT